MDGNCYCSKWRKSTSIYNPKRIYKKKCYSTLILAHKVHDIIRCVHRPHNHQDIIDATHSTFILKNRIMGRLWRTYFANTAQSNTHQIILENPSRHMPAAMENLENTKICYNLHEYMRHIIIIFKQKKNANEKKSVTTKHTNMFYLSITTMMMMMMVLCSDWAAPLLSLCRILDNCRHSSKSILAIYVSITLHVLMFFFYSICLHTLTNMV